MKLWWWSIEYMHKNKVLEGYSYAALHWEQKFQPVLKYNNQRMMENLWLLP